MYRQTDRQRGEREVVKKTRVAESGRDAHKLPRIETAHVSDLNEEKRERKRER